MSTLIENFNTIKKQLNREVDLVAVSKTKPIEMIQAMYDAGQRDFGENKVQELVAKAEVLPKDIRWHMIGHLQRNKVKYLTNFVHLIHGVDSLRLAKEINKQAAKHDRIQSVLLQIHIAEEETKFGLSEEELEELLVHHKFENIQVRGLMGMATNTTDEAKVRREFEHLKALFDKWKQNQSNFDTLSMGMTQDFKIAQLCGSTMVRVGSAIFGTRSV